MTSGIKYRGSIYQSLTSLATVLDIPVGSLYKRLSRGSTLEEAISKSLRDRYKKEEQERIRSVQMEINGTKNAEQRKQVKTLLDNQFVADTTDEKPDNESSKSIQTKSRAMVKFDGKPYNNRTELCKAFGLSSVIVKEFASKTGYNFIDSFGLIVSFIGNLDIVDKPRGMLSAMPFAYYNGIVFDTVEDLANHLNLNSRRLSKELFESSTKNIDSVLSYMQEETSMMYFYEGEYRAEGYFRTKRLHFAKLRNGGVIKGETRKLYSMTNYPSNTPVINIRHEYNKYIDKCTLKRRLTTW